MAYNTKDLFVAINNNNLTEIKNIISSFGDDKAKLFELLSIPDSDGDTPLHLAAKNGHTEILKLIINKLSPKEGLKLLSMTNTQGRNVYADTRIDNKQMQQLLTSIGANLCIVSTAEGIGQRQQEFESADYILVTEDTLIENIPEEFRGKVITGQQQQVIEQAVMPPVQAMPSGALAPHTSQTNFGSQNQQDTLLDIQDAFAYTILIKAQHLMPSVVKVSQQFLKIIGPTLQKYISEDKSLNNKDNNLVNFFLEPMLPASNELGSMPKSTEQVNKTKVAQWLLDTLKKSEPATLYTHLRCHIRYSHFMSEEANIDNIEKYNYGYDKTHLDKEGFEDLHKKLDYYIKERIERGSREKTGIDSVSDKSGICPNHSEFTQLLAKKIKLPVHFRAVEAIKPLFNSSYNKTANKNNIPLIAGPSGAMMHF